MSRDFRGPLGLRVDGIVAMELITAHIGADFDCLAAMAAAAKLYPDASLVLPGSQESSVRQFLQSNRFSQKLIKLRQVDLRAVGRLIVVDTQSKNRLGSLASLLDRSDVEVHLYDHHADAVRDFRVNFEDVRPVGATTTILVDILRARGIPISAEEATLFNLGIHEDTGSFTSINTTREDLEAAAYLLSCGADLSQVGGLLQRELNPAQVSLLNELMESAERIWVLSVPVAVATASREDYVEDIAQVAQKFRVAYDASAFFFLVRMGDKVQLIARSRAPEIDVGAIAGFFGGGGHPSASSASIKDLTLFQARDRLVDRLQRETHRRRKAGEIMVSSVRTVPMGAPIRDAAALMTRYNLNALPVMDGERVAGLITRPVVEKAIFHRLGEEVVGDYMNRDFETLTPDAPAERALEMILGRRQKLIPVLTGDASDPERPRLAGVIARGDILHYLHEDVHPADVRAKPHMRGVRTLARERLPKPVCKLLERAAQVADALGCTVYVVGGIVRDLLMGIDNPDVDLVVEGDGIAFAQRLAAEEGGRSRSHPRYGTAVVTVPDGRKVDVATTRAEFYEQPAALPIVEMSDIRTDLYRRDFTINAMAIQLNGARAWRLLDFFGARRDLKEKVIRVLHSLSFVEDPTRAFRAVRFAERYGFTIGAQTRSLLENAVRSDLFDRLSGRRLFTELRLILSEPEPWRYVNHLDRLKLLRFIHPRLKATSALRRRFREIDQSLAWYELLFTGRPVEAWMVYLLGLFGDFTDEEAETACARLFLAGAGRSRVMQARKDGADVLAGLCRDDLLPSAVYCLLHPLPIETLLFSLAVAPSQQAKKYISLYLTHLKEVKPSIGGNDLMAMGVEPGPIYEELLAATRDALLDGLIEHGAISERAFVRRRLALQAPS
ncbi:MAG: CBS domain-containing protein [Nitrospinota bacterium]